MVRIKMFGNPEFEQRYSGRYFGKYRGLVTQIDTESYQLLRIMARVPVVLGTSDEVGWAWPANGGGQESGIVWSPSVNDYVWIEFEEGDPNRPLWSPGPMGRRGGESMLPKHVRGELDSVDNQLRSVGIIPASSFAGEYPKVRMLQTPKKHFLEFDDTDGHERVQLAHKDGTRLEMLADSSMEIVVGDELRHYVKEAYKLEVVKELEALIREAATIESSQTLTLKSAGGEILLSIGVPGIQLGGSGANEAFVKGNALQSLLTSILTTVATHTHASFGAPPTESAAILAYIAQISGVLSTYITGK